MELIVFSHAVVARTVSDDLLIALMGGAGAVSGAMSHECVALLSCRPETAIALCAGLGSAAKDDT